MSSVASQEQLLPGAVQELLGEAIVAKSIEYYWALPGIFIATPDGAGLDTSNHDVADIPFLDLVLLGDARAHSLHRDPGKLTPFSWAEMARKGIRKATREVPGMQDLERKRLFSKDHPAVQLEAYTQMKAMRFVQRGPEIEEFSGISYAARVAMGEIALRH